MRRKRRHDGEYIELVWDGPQTEHYVAGHVTTDEFRAELARWFATEREGEPSVVMPAGAVVEYGYARSVPRSLRSVSAHVSGEWFRLDDKSRAILIDAGLIQGAG